MTGHEKRAAQIEKRILEVSIQMIDQYGVRKVSLDEIAEQAEVSKVTIYKYFGSKKGLVDAVISCVYKGRMDAMKDILDRDMDFKQKLDVLIGMKNSSAGLMEGRFLKTIMKANGNPYEKETEELFIRFFEEGKRTDYIDPAIPNDVLISYFHIFRAGLECQLDGGSSPGMDESSFEQMVSLFFHGFVRRR